MYSKKAVIVNEVGLYGRSATSLIQFANTFKSTVFIESDDKKVNSKSLLGVLSLALAKGTEVTVSAEGSDEVTAVNAISDFISAGCIQAKTDDNAAPLVSSSSPTDVVDNSNNSIV